MLNQYRALKARYPDALLLYRLGDFYELFEGDAKQVARELGLVLTSRRFSKEIQLPMCGIPYHRLTSYLARLIKSGHKVAIAEQLEDARQTRHLVKRDIVRVITPGTVIEDALLRDYEESLLVGIVVQDGRPNGASAYGLAVLDLASGEFRTTQIDGPMADSTFWEELDRLAPSEVVLPHSLASDPSFCAQLADVHPARLSPIQANEFSPQVAAERLKNHLGISTLEGCGCAGLHLATGAAGGLLYYLETNQVSDLAHIVRLSTYDLSSYMVLDPVTRRNLELVYTLREGRYAGSLYETIDRTQTAMGRRLMRRWLTQPLLDLGAIRDRQDAIAELVNQAMLRAELDQALDGMYDVERLVGRIGFGNANARDLVALRQTLELVPRVLSLLSQLSSTQFGRIKAYLDMETLQAIATMIAAAIVDDPPILLTEGGLIRQGYEEKLESLRRVARAGRDWIAEFEARERERTAIKNLRIRYNQVFGFFIEVTKSNLDKVPPEYERRATVRHAERFVTPALKDRESQILNAETQIKTLEYDLFVAIRKRIAADSASLTGAARALAELDALVSLAQVAALNGYTRPAVDDSTMIAIEQGRHPVVEHTLPDGERFVANDTTIDRDERFAIITGPNMSGKSVYIRQVALIVLLAQMGSFVPAAQAHIGLVDRIFVRAGASDDITQGRSTFLVEMSETSYILGHATARSLVVLDEVGRGTSTYDGMSIAWAVAEELHDRIGARTLFATHFHELTDLVQTLPAARNYTLAISEKEHQIIFLRQLIPGSSDKSYGIQVARLAGLPDHVVMRAQEILVGLEEELGQEKLTIRNAVREEVPPRPPAWLAQETSMDALRQVLNDLYHLDLATLTPIQAMIALHELQQRLGKGRS
jgi:DNA mismatch repair protein MutS